MTWIMIVFSCHSNINIVVYLTANLLRFHLQYPTEPRKSASMRLSSDINNIKDMEQHPSKSKRLLKALLSRHKSKKDDTLYTYLDEYWWYFNTVVYRMNGKSSSKEHKLPTDFALRSTNTILNVCLVSDIDACGLFQSLLFFKTITGIYLSVLMMCLISMPVFYRVCFFVLHIWLRGCPSLFVPSFLFECFFLYDLKWTYIW